MKRANETRRTIVPFVLGLLAPITMLSGNFVCAELPPEYDRSDELDQLGLLDVTKAPHSADRTGEVDSTAAIQRAADDARDNGLVCFFPEGTYLISDTISCEQEVAKLGAATGERLAAIEEVVLEDATVRVVMREGRLISLLDKARSLEHVSPDADPARGLFNMQFVRGMEPAGRLDATEMHWEVTRKTPNAAEIQFDHARATACVQVRLGESPGETHWSIFVEPKDAALAVGHVTCPVIVTPRSVEGEEKRYLFPMFEGRFAPLRQPPLWRAHPSHLFAQMIACVGPAGSFVVWTDDGEGHLKAFGFTNRGANADFGARHLMPFEPGAAWEAPYRTRVTLCGGAWRDAADVYREWATSQPWSNSPFRDRRDMPELLRHPPLCLSTQLDKEDLDDLPDRLAAWRERLDVPIVYRPLGWEKHGNWTGIDYFPPSIGEDAFRNLAARLKERGAVMSGFVSGYRWTTHSQRASEATNEELADFFVDGNGAATCERMRNGELLSFLAEGRTSHRICRGTDFGRDFLPSIAGELFDRGVVAIHDDQDHGPYPDGVQSCFDRAHGHPVPCGRWSTDATRESFQEIRAEAARRGLTDFFLTKESCTDLLNMDLHAYQARFFHESTRPKLVPLTQYLYHEHIPVIFGWVTANSRSTWELAAMLVYGQIPSLAFWNATAQRPDEIPAAAVTLLDDYFAAMKTHAKPFLLYGRMRRPLIVDAPVVRKEIRRIKGRVLRRPQELIMPLVIQSAWHDGGGNVGVYAVNTQEKDVILKVQAPDEGRWHAMFYTGSAREDEHDVATGGELSWHLEPGRLGAVVFQRIE
jgi:hypothetical protein